MSWRLSATIPDDQCWLWMRQENERLLLHEPAWTLVMKTGLGPEPICGLLSQGGAL
jgi:hypothetical protein